MDAKPQRPMRTLRVRADENALPMAPIPKTLHSRNKSSPALSSMAAAAASKSLGIKRTAFGDVSNTSHVNRPIRDDSIIKSKAGYELKENAITFYQDKKPSAILRPAQRPLSVSGLKALLNNVTNTGLSGTTKLETQPPANNRKVLTKRNTTVFRETSEQHLEPAVVDLYKQLPAKPLPAPVHRELNSHTHETYTTEPQPDLRRRESKRAVLSEKPPPAEVVVVQDTSSETNVVHSDGAFIDDFGNVQVCEYIDETDYVEGGVATYVDESIQQKEAPRVELVTRLPEVIDTSVEKSLPTSLPPQILPIASEPEEYWDEEEDNDYYEEEGYVTARSYKSRGENTTGGATTILFPKVTNKVRKELAAAKEIVEASRTQDEIEDEAYDMSMVVEYGDEIFAYMKELEIKMLPNAHYMDNQAEIQWSMRAVLMDWLVQVHHRFGLLPETLFLCVNYIDRFLSCKIVSLGKLQLVGATAIFVAAKYEEINCPSVQEIVYMVDGGYTVDEILKAERFMLSMLQFELGWPGPMSFLRRISKADDYDLETRTLAKYFLEVTIMDERFLSSPPSFAAAGAHCLARMMLKKGTWTPAHVYYSNYTYSQLHPFVQLLFECCENPQKHHAAIYDKYTDKRYKRASHFVETEIKRGFQVIDVAVSNAAPFVNLYNLASPYESKSYETKPYDSKSYESKSTYS